jgi:hypothetical protein
VNANVVNVNKKNLQEINDTPTITDEKFSIALKEEDLRKELRKSLIAKNKNMVSKACAIQ